MACHDPEEVMRALESEPMADLHTHLMGMGSHEFWVREILFNYRVMPTDDMFQKCFSTKEDKVGDFEHHGSPEDTNIKSVCCKAAPLVWLGDTEWGETVHYRGSGTFSPSYASQAFSAAAGPSVPHIRSRGKKPQKFASPDRVIEEMHHMSAFFSDAETTIDDLAKVDLHDVLSRLLRTKAIEFRSKAIKDGRYIEETRIKRMKFTFEVVLQVSSLQKAFNIPSNVSGEEYIVEDSLRVRFSEPSHIRNWIVWDAMAQRFDIRRGIRLSDLRRHITRMRQDRSRESDYKVAMANLRNAFSMLSRDGSFASDHDFHSFRSYFTPQFYPRRFVLKDDIVAQRLDVLAYLIEHVLSRNDRCRPAVVYVEFSFSLKKSLSPHVMAVLRWCCDGTAQFFEGHDRQIDVSNIDDSASSASRASRASSVPSLIPTFRKAECQYRFLAAVNRQAVTIGKYTSQAELITFLETFTGGAIQAYLEAIDFDSEHAMFDAYKKHIHRLHNFVRFAPSDVFQYVVGVDLVGDELGYPYNPLATHAFIEVLKRAIARNPKFGIRIHAGENIPFLRPQAYQFRAFAAHMYILFLGIQRLVKTFSSSNVRVGHGVAFHHVVSDHHGGLDDGETDSASGLTDMWTEIDGMIKQGQPRHSFLLLRTIRGLKHVINYVVREVNRTSNKFLVRYPHRQAVLLDAAKVVLSTDDDGIWPIDGCKLHHGRHFGLAAELCDVVHQFCLPLDKARALLRLSMQAAFFDFHESSQQNDAASVLLYRNIDGSSGSDDDHIRLDGHTEDELIAHSNLFHVRSSMQPGIGGIDGPRGTDGYSWFPPVPGIVVPHKPSFSMAGNGQGPIFASIPNIPCMDATEAAMLSCLVSAHCALFGTALVLSPTSKIQLSPDIDAVLRALLLSFLIGAEARDESGASFAFLHTCGTTTTTYVFLSGTDVLDQELVRRKFDFQQSLKVRVYMCLPNKCWTSQGHDALHDAVELVSYVATATSCVAAEGFVFGDGLRSTHIRAYHDQATITISCNCPAESKVHPLPEIHFLHEPNVYFVCLHNRAAAAAYRVLCGLQRVFFKDAEKPCAFTMLDKHVHLPLPFLGLSFDSGYDHSGQSSRSSRCPSEQSSPVVASAPHDGQTSTVPVHGASTNISGARLAPPPAVRSTESQTFAAAFAKRPDPLTAKQVGSCFRHLRSMCSLPSREWVGRVLRHQDSQETPSLVRSVLSTAHHYSNNLLHVLSIVHAEARRAYEAERLLMATGRALVHMLSTFQLQPTQYCTMDVDFDHCRDQLSESIDRAIYPIIDALFHDESRHHDLGRPLRLAVPFKACTHSSAQRCTEAFLAATFKHVSTPLDAQLFCTLLGGIVPDLWSKAAEPTPGAAAFVDDGYGELARTAMRFYIQALGQLCRRGETGTEVLPQVSVNKIFEDDRSIDAFCAELHSAPFHIQDALTREAMAVKGVFSVGEGAANAPWRSQLRNKVVQHLLCDDSAGVDEELAFDVAVYWKKVNKPNKAIKALQSITSSRRSPRVLVQAHERLSAMYYKQKELQRAREAARQGLQVCKSYATTTSQWDEARCKYRLGKAQDHPKEAIKLFDEVKTLLCVAVRDLGLATNGGDPMMALNDLEQQVKGAIQSAIRGEDDTDQQRFLFYLEYKPTQVPSHPALAIGSVQANIDPFIPEKNLLPPPFLPFHPKHTH